MQNTAEKKERAALAGLAAASMDPRDPRPAHISRRGQGGGAEKLHRGKRVRFGRV